MAELHKLFKEFNENIELSSDYKKKITTGRKALREKISSKFEEEDRKKPKYCTQGSYIMGTAISPLEDDEFDLDNGVYLQGFSDEKDEWITTATAHNWVKNAVDGHTSTAPIDKNTCVRVIYKEKYHIDLPIYIVRNEEQTDGTMKEVAYLAHKSKGWCVSDPKAFTKWFRQQLNDNGEQFRRIVRYLKAWKAYKKIDLKGIAITILVANFFQGQEDRDDIALLNTVTDIIDNIEDEFHCYKPVTPIDEDLFADISETTKNSIINGLKTLKNKLDKAINEEKNEKKASEILIKVFGDRFPEGDENVKTTSAFVATAAPIALGGVNSHFA